MAFQGKSVLITGASSGIGAACAELLATEGARLLLTGRSTERLEAVAARCRPAETHTVAVDLTNLEELRRLAETARDLFGSLDIVIHSAGVGLYAPASEAEPELVRQLFETNYFAVVELTRQLLPSIPAGGSIVVVSSIAGLMPLPWHNAYSSSKFALNAYCDSLRMELTGTGRQVLCVCPGLVETPFREHVLAGRAPTEVMRQPRFHITAEQCAKAILRGIRSGRRTVVTPIFGWFAVWASRLVPWLVHARMAKMRRS